MTPLYLAAIAGLPVGLFHDPGPTLAAQYPPLPFAEEWCRAAMDAVARFGYL